MIERPPQNNLESLDKLNIGQAAKMDIQGILQVQNEQSLSDAIAKGKSREEIERSGFLVHMLTAEELEKLLDMPQDVIVLSCKENEKVLGYSIGYAVKLWKELHPNWENSIRFFNDFGLQDVGNDAVYCRHVAASKAGVGAQLTRELVRMSQERGFTKMLGEIAKEPYINRVSSAVHKRMGFEEIGEIDEILEGAQYKWGLVRKMFVDKN